MLYHTSPSPQPPVSGTPLAPYRVAVFELDANDDHNLLRIDGYSATDGKDGCLDGYDPRATCHWVEVDAAAGPGYAMKALLHTFPASPSATQAGTYALWSRPDGTALTFALSADGRQFTQPTLINSLSPGLVGTSFSGDVPQPCPVPDPNFDPFQDPTDPNP